MALLDEEKTQIFMHKKLKNPGTLTGVLFMIKHLCLHK